MMIFRFNCFDTGYPISGFVDFLCFNYVFDKGLDPVYRRNSVEFLIDFRKLENLEIMSLGWVLGSRFSNWL